MKGGSPLQIPDHTQFCHVKDALFNLISCRLFTNGCSLEGLHLEKKKKLSKLCSGIGAAFFHGNQIHVCQGVAEIEFYFIRVWSGRR